MTELEKKLLLSAEEYQYLFDRFCKEKTPTKQVNYYFDTEDFEMNHKNITCRIRFKDGCYKGTVKQHKSDSDRSLETEIQVRDGIYDNAFIDMGLKFKGQLVTERVIIFKDLFCEVVLDKNDYLGCTDYELEVEYCLQYEEEASAIYKEFLDMFKYRRCVGLFKDKPIYKKATSKSKRFFARMLSKCVDG